MLWRCQDVFDDRCYVGGPPLGWPVLVIGVVVGNDVDGVHVVVVLCVDTGCDVDFGVDVFFEIGSVRRR